MPFEADGTADRTDVVVHLFNQESRMFYDLDNLWGDAKKIEWDQKFQLVKINPIADWTNDDVWDYIRANSVPYNALHDTNFTSIGCTHCTRAVRPGEDSRAGRWSGFQKTECGLHLPDAPVAGNALVQIGSPSGS